MADFKEAKKEINLLLETISPSIENVDNQTEPKNGLSDMDILFSIPQAKKPKNSKWHQELEMFLSNNSKLNGQQFWEANKFDMPNLYRIYKQSGAVQLSSGSIERLFSQAKLVYNDLAAQMEPETIFFNLLNSKNFD